jgi:hypothetical protein
LEAKWGRKGWLYLPLPKHLGPIGLVWRRFGWAALARFEVQGSVASTLALLPGFDSDDDELCLSILQILVTTVLQAAGREPAFELRAVEERPAAVRVAWKNQFANPVRRRHVGRLERAIAAAFFARVMMRSEQ